MRGILTLDSTAKWLWVFSILLGSLFAFEFLFASNCSSFVDQKGMSQWPCKSTALLIALGLICCAVLILLSLRIGSLLLIFMIAAVIWHDLIAQAAPVTSIEWVGKIGAGTAYVVTLLMAIRLIFREWRKP